MSHTTCTKDQSATALKRNQGDIVNAIMELSGCNSVMKFMEEYNNNDQDIIIQDDNIEYNFCTGTDVTQINICGHSNFEYCEKWSDICQKKTYHLSKMMLSSIIQIILIFK